MDIKILNLLFINRIFSLLSCENDPNMQKNIFFQEYVLVREVNYEVFAFFRNPYTVLKCLSPPSRLKKHLKQDQRRVIISAKGKSSYPHGNYSPHTWHGSGMNWITPHIAIGNVQDAQILASGVDTILCLKPNCCSEDREDVEVISLPFIDGSGNRARDLRDAIDSIDAAVQGGEKILVHCHAGRSRSVMVVAAYLVARCGLTAQSALNLIQSKREIFLSPGIEELLELARRIRLDSNR